MVNIPTNLCECVVCSHRVRAEHTLTCPRCAGPMQNLSNPRE
ncbi:MULTISPECIES: rubrerythrin-like domain-containing protein [Natrialbaceae]